MNSKVFLVTGATDGIGKATALALARSGATVILHGRDQAKTEDVLAEIGSATDNPQLHAAVADFAALDQVAALAEQIGRKFERLDVLINNAGMLGDQRQTSRNGFELTFAVNYLAPFLLTHRLLDLLRSSPPARIVNVSSSALGGGVIDMTDLQSERRFDPWHAYANSKLANVLFNNLLAEQLAGTDVVANALCPGLIDTNLLHNTTVFGDQAIEHLRMRMRTPEEGAQVPLYVATADETADVTGQFYLRHGQDTPQVLPLAWDRRTAAELWAHSSAALAQWL